MAIPVKRHVLFLLAWLLACPALLAQEPKRNILFGMPSSAKADPEQRTDYVIARPQYVLSYKAETKTPKGWALGGAEDQRGRNLNQPRDRSIRFFQEVRRHVHGALT
jgi:hypothetical protein